VFVDFVSEFRQLLRNLHVAAALLLAVAATLALGAVGNRLDRLQTYVLGAIAHRVDQGVGNFSALVVTTATDRDQVLHRFDFLRRQILGLLDLSSGFDRRHFRLEVRRVRQRFQRRRPFPLRIVAAPVAHRIAGPLHGLRDPQKTPQRRRGRRRGRRQLGLRSAGQNQAERDQRDRRFSERHNFILPTARPDQCAQAWPIRTATIHSQNRQIRSNPEEELGWAALPTQTAQFPCPDAASQIVNWPARCMNANRTGRVDRRRS
jgi:hypothetical protein